MVPKELEGAIVDQTGALVIQMRKQIVQNQLTTPGKVRILAPVRQREMANAIARRRINQKNHMPEAADNFARIRRKQHASRRNF
jgi:hypothetical protein